MKNVDKRVIVNHSVEKIYSLVADVASYPDFIDYCESARCVQRQGDNECWQLSFMLMGYTVDVISRNQLKPNQEITVWVDQGIMQSLQGRWLFQSLSSDRTLVQLSLNYDLGSGWLSYVATEQMVQVFVQQVMAAFVRRADQI